MAGAGSTPVEAFSGAAAEVQYVRAKTSVWWDIENCAVPRSCDPHLIAQNISKALAALDYKGAVSISAYGDTSKINSNVQQALSSTGVSLNHVPAGVKDASDKKILVDMLFWAVDNPPPANFLLISGDRDFSNALHQLRMRRYNILLAQPADVSQALVTAAKSVWLWTNLLMGGPPLPESSPSHHGSSNTQSTADKPSNNIPKSAQPSVANNQNNNTNNGMSDTYNQKNHNNGKSNSYNLKSHSNGKNGDFRNKGKQNQNNQNEPNNNIPRTTSNGNKGKKFNGNSNASSPKKKDGTNQTNHKNNKPSSSHFNNEPNNNTSTGSTSNNDANNFPKHPQNQPFQLLRPSDFRPQVNIQPGNLFESNPRVNSYPQFPPAPTTMPNGFPLMPSAPPSTFSSLHDISRFNLLGYPNNLHQNATPFYPNSSYDYTSYNGLLGTLDPEEHVGFVLRALDTLKADKMAPTEVNISDCIRYGDMNIQNFNVRKALNYAIVRRFVSILLEYDSYLYIKKDDTVWKYLNTMDSDSKHPNGKYDAVKNFLSSSDGRAAILKSQSRYQAAVMLRKSCLRENCLGKILQILHMVIHVRKWIVPHTSGWQPLSLTISMDSVLNGWDDDGKQTENIALDSTGVVAISQLA